MATSVLAAVCVVAGLAIRPSSLTLAGLLAVVLVWDQQTYSSHQVLVILMLCYLAFSESGRSRTVPLWPQDC